MTNESKTTGHITQDESKPDQEGKYKSVRIQPGDFRFLKDWAHYSDSKIIDRISYLIENYKDILLLEKETAVKSMYFINEEHKSTFVRYLMLMPYITFTEDYLIAFYTNAAINIFIEDYREPFSWTGTWDKDGKNFTPSKEFLEMGKAEQQLVEFATTLFATQNPSDVIQEIVDINRESLPLAQQMIRLKLNGLSK